MMAIVAAMLQQGMSMPSIEAHVGPYKSRGKGRASPRGKSWFAYSAYSNGSKYQPHQGAKECARRMRQIGGAA